MWHNLVTVLALCQCLALISAAPTWPSSIDEIEDLMMLQTGYRARGFASPVTPCTNSPVSGFRFAAGFVRTAFHDAAAYDAAAGTGGLDGSIAAELEGTFKVHNTGPIFNATISYMTEFINSKASLSDLIALGLYSSVRSCGGPQIPMKAGRIDATGAGPDALPDAADSASTLVGRFARMGFSPTEMIQLVACGHTLGGVHPAQNPSVTTQNPAQAQAQGVLTFDTTDTGFDNRVATEYISGTTRNPLVVGPAALNSDLRVFSVDNNVTIRSMASSSNVYQGLCQHVMQKMIENVPSNVQLSDVIQAYDVKPGQLNLNVVDNGASLVFSGEIRVRTNNLPKSSIASVQIVYNDRSGSSCAGCTITAVAAGDANGFDDSFTFYGFSAKITSISSFSVVITTTSGQIRSYNNNGGNFPMNDNAFVQASSSSLSGSNLNVVVAVRSGQQGTPQLTMSVRNPHAYNTVPSISNVGFTVSKICGNSLFTYYSATANVAGQQNSARFDLSVGGTKFDTFRGISFASSAVAPNCGAVSTTTTTAATSSTTTTKTTSSSNVSNTRTSGSSSTSTSSSSTSSISSSTTGALNPTLSTNSTISSNSTLTVTSSSTSNIIDPTLTSTTSSTITDISFTLSTTTPSDTTGTSSTSVTTIEPDLTSTTTSDTAEYTPPSWTQWDPVTVVPNPSSAITGVASDNTPYPTGTSGSSGYNGNDNAAELLSSIYQDHYNEPAPSDGTDGGNKNIEGLDLSIKVTIVTPTVTGTSAIGSSNGWGTWATTAPVVATSTATWAGAEVGSSSKPSATKSGKVGQYTGAANSIMARGEVAMIGAAALVGAVALVL